MRTLCRIFGHKDRYSHHPSLSRVGIPLVCVRCGRLADQSVAS